jgi:hypothetical protein
MMLGIVAWAALALPPEAVARPFAIQVVDQQTGRGVPLIELKTVNEVRYYTDSNGLVAFDEPGLMGQDVFFHVSGHGYEYPKDGFGIRGKARKVEPGGEARIEVQRTNIAERLYRVTGGGIYADSLRLGRPAPTKDPVLNGLVFGSDSVMNAVYKGKIHWFWGDTNRPSYPLGNFHVPGAVSELPSRGGLDPDVGINLSYFVDENGFAKQTCTMPGEGPTWIGGLVNIRDERGEEHLFAGYVKVRGYLEVYEHGLVRYNDSTNRFDKAATFREGEAIYPNGHTFVRDVDGKPCVYFATPYPWTRVRATADDLAHPERYEGYTCLKAGTRPDQAQLDRDGEGKLRYAWKANTPPLDHEAQAKLIEKGAMRADESILELSDAATGKAVQAHGGSVYWNDYRRRWVMIAVEIKGTSMLGEVWYAEAPEPEGPWTGARKVVTHENYSFYNPKQHPFFDREGGRIIYFEGTYTTSFSGNPAQPTPRYEYNQILYKLDLADPRLGLPEPGGDK